LGHQPLHWLGLVQGAAVVQRNTSSSPKTGKKTIRDMLPNAKAYRTTGQLTAEDLDRLDNAVLTTAPLSTKAKEPRVRNRPTMAEIRSLESRLTKHQLSSVRMISTLQMECHSQARIYQSREIEMTHTIVQMKSILTANHIAAIKPRVIEPPTIVDMANDISDDDPNVLVMTWESVEQTSAINSSL